MKIVLYGSPVIAFQSELLGRLQNSVQTVTVDYDASDDELQSAFDNADAVISVRYDPHIPASPALRLVQVPGVGCDEVDLDALPANATLCNVSGHGTAVAEYVILGMLQCCHRFIEADSSFREGSWTRSSRFQAQPHRELAGSVVGIVGYGEIGHSLAARLKPFGVRTLVCNRSEPPMDGLYEAYYPLADLREMAVRCDFLVLSVALAAETRDLVDQKILGAMKSSSVLINVGRGPVVNETDLFAALRDGWIGGAVLDVWYRYPANVRDVHARPSKHDFASLPNVYMTPHVSGWTTGTVDRRWSDIAENIIRLSKGQALLHVVDRRSLES